MTAADGPTYRAGETYDMTARVKIVTARDVRGGWSLFINGIGAIPAWIRSDAPGVTLTRVEPEWVPYVPYQRPNQDRGDYSIWVYEPDQSLPWHNLHNGCRQAADFLKPGDLVRLVPEATP